MGKLKPCPKCFANKALIRTDFLTDGYWIQCSDCNHQEPKAKTAIEAMDAWNRRPAPPATKEKEKEQEK